MWRRRGPAHPRRTHGHRTGRARLNAERDRLIQVRDAATRLSTTANEASERELSSADQHPAEQATETLERELDLGVLQSVDSELDGAEGGA